MVSLETAASFPNKNGLLVAVVQSMFVVVCSLMKFISDYGLWLHVALLLNLILLVDVNIFGKTHYYEETKKT